ncbi:MAG: methylated-DNA--[protein]-cysteine S-methyltransferase [Acidobacteria bacterium]|nr:methylated-DNA--[protein]-cysteine S-methyltransferase [Acidobacteriota bacterium]
MEELSCQELDTPIGRLLVAATGTGLCRVCFPNELSGHWCNWFNRHFAAIPKRSPSPLLQRAWRELREYFEKKRTTFDVPLDLRGTTYQVLVWRELSRIPYGTTISYGDLARRLGNAGAARAVGSIIAQNPVPVVLPCHRVVGCTGALVGFAGGLAIKEQLLEFEGARLCWGKLSAFPSTPRKVN